MAKRHRQTRPKMARPRGYAAGRNVRIGDPARLKDLIAGVVCERFGGSTARAARETRMTRALLRRVLSGKQRSVRTDNIQLLREFVGRRFRDVEQCLVAGAARNRLDQYDRWLDAQFETVGLGVVHANRGRRPRPNDGRSTRRLAATYHLLQRLRRDFASEFAPLIRDTARRHYVARADLALRRVVSPLLDALDTAGIERSVTEFSASELRAFIRAGVKRERLLLRRDADLQRSHTAPRPSYPTGGFGQRRPVSSSDSDIEANLRALPHTDDWDVE